ncbi:hypothetical protein [Virgibacillus necropolis]|uniref:PsbP C-terminal domain-containing protein n=1 Tax=Virgibacillus necropolis TaxID=163877 RepID=A0A221M7D9_9BACI|nr:hypothetical protein [Virgibacillus necropolis]ASN03547.1 hypothetical protein CFK40_00165 [Virgibacillus necropolis]
MKKRSRYIVAVSTAVVLGVVGFGLKTNTDQAVNHNLKEMFKQEKEISLEIEGQTEQTDVMLETNEDNRYIIYVDDSRYKMESSEESDKIVPLIELEDKYPEVSMEIIQVANTTIEEEIAKAKQEVKEYGLNVKRTVDVTAPMEGKVVKYMTEGPQNWDSLVYKYYFLKAGTNLFLVRQKYFFAASEGHGVRFDSMLESFKVVDPT